MGEVIFSPVYKFSYAYRDSCTAVFWLFIWWRCFSYKRRLPVTRGQVDEMETLTTILFAALGSRVMYVTCCVEPIKPQLKERNFPTQWIYLLFVILIIENYYFPERDHIGCAVCLLWGTNCVFIQREFVSPGWALQNGRHHLSLCSNHVVRSTASSTAINNTVCSTIFRRALANKDFSVLTVMHICSSAGRILQMSCSLSL